MEQTGLERELELGGELVKIRSRSLGGYPWELLELTQRPGLGAHGRKVVAVAWFSTYAKAESWLRRHGYTEERRLAGSEWFEKPSGGEVLYRVRPRLMVALDPE